MASKKKVQFRNFTPRSPWKLEQLRCFRLRARRTNFCTICTTDLCEFEVCGNFHTKRAFEKALEFNKRPWRLQEGRAACFTQALLLLLSVVADIPPQSRSKMASTRVSALVVRRQLANAGKRMSMYFDARCTRGDLEWNEVKFLQINREWYSRE